MFKTLILVVVVLFSSQLAAEKIYKWVDENGQIHYAAQKPAGQEAETVKLRKAPKAAPKAETEATNPAPDAADDSTAEVDAEAEAAAKARLAAADKINNKKQCDLARKNYAALNASVRVSRTNEQGETVRMTDDERVKAMQAAQQGIKKYCQ
jgi:hypothetical protein